MDKIGEMAAFIRREMAAGRLTSGAQCRPALKAKWPDVTDRDCLLVALRVGAERALGVSVRPANDGARS